jgi:hypothetical protein
MTGGPAFRNTEAAKDGLLSASAYTRPDVSLWILLADRPQTGTPIHCLGGWSRGLALLSLTFLS